MYKLLRTLIFVSASSMALNTFAATLASLDASDTSYGFTSNATIAAGGGFGDWTTGGNAFFPSGDKNNGFGTFSDNTGVNNGLRLDFAGSPNTLSSGQSIIVDFSHGSIASGGAAAVELWSGGISRFSFYFNGGASNYGYFVDGSGDTLTDIGFTSSVQTVKIDIGASNAFTLSVNGIEKGTGSLSGTVDNLRVVNRAANTTIIDNLTIIPEPSSIVMLGLTGLAAGGIALLKRRKRA